MGSCFRPYLRRSHHTVKRPNLSTCERLDERRSRDNRVLLETVGTVERNACELKVQEAKSIAKAFMLLMVDHELHSWDALVAIVHNQFPDETIDKIQESGKVVRDFWEASI